MPTLLAAAPAVLAADESSPNPLLPHVSEIIVSLVAFALLYLFLKAKVFQVFERVFAERTEAIQGGMEKAEREQEEAQRALEQYKAQLA